MVDRSHTPHAVPPSRRMVARPMSSKNLRLNHAVDPCVVDIQRHLNEPGQPDWPTFGELERRCRLGWRGFCCNGHRHKWMGHNNWSAWTACVNGIQDCALKCDRGLATGVSTCMFKKGWAKELLQQNLARVNQGPSHCRCWSSDQREVRFVC